MFEKKKKKQEKKTLAWPHWQLETINLVIKGNNALVTQPTVSQNGLASLSHPLRLREVHGPKPPPSNQPYGWSSWEVPSPFCDTRELFMPNGQPYQHFTTLVAMGKIGLLAIDEAHIAISLSSFRSVLRYFNYSLF